MSEEGLAVATSKTIVCPVCYLATDIVLTTEPRNITPGMLWLCGECKDMSVFDGNLDLVVATDEQKRNAGRR
jgi:hypothetical protein